MSSASDWIETVDKASGRTYYYNKVTKKTQWTRPPEMDGAPAAEPAATPATPTATATPATDTSDPENDPANWSQTVDKTSGRSYYYNKVTKKTSWKMPACMEATNGAAAAPATPASPAAAVPATPTAAPAETPATPAAAPATTTTADPSVWAEATDAKSGKKYWYNRVTKETTWKNPLGDDAAATTPATPAAVPASPAPAVTPATPASPTNGTAKDDDDDDDNSVKMGAQQDEEKKKDDDEEDVKEYGADDIDDDDDEDDDKGKKEEAKKGDDNADKLLKLKQAMGEKDKNQAVKSGDKNQDDEDEGGDQLRITKQRKGFWKRLFRAGDPLDEKTVLSFKKSLIKKSILKPNRHLDEEAIQNFKNVMSYMGDRPSSKKGPDHAKKMLRNLMLAPSGLRDEAYMHLIKQTTSNPKTDSLVKGWELMLFCLATFPPSKALKRYLTDYINKAATSSTEPKVVNLAKACQDAIPKIVQMGQRKQVPSMLELEHLKDLKPVPIRINLVKEGEHRMLNVDPYKLVSEVQEEMYKKLNLTCTPPFALYEAAGPNVERMLEGKDRILDVVASWENAPLDEDSKDEKKKVPAKDLKKEVKKTAYNSLLFKAKLVLKTKTRELMGDPEAVNLIYLQAVSDVVTSRYPSNEKDITVLAALQLQATQGDYKKGIHVPGWLVPKLHEYMPKDLLQKKDKNKKDKEKTEKEWEQMILDKYQKVAGFSALEAKLNYLDYVQEWVFYGSQFFLVEQRQFKDYPSPLWLGINCEGVLLMHPEKKTVLENYLYTDIVTWGHSDEKFIIVVGNIVQQRKLIFKTDEGKAMNHLIHDYVKFKVKDSGPRA